MKKITLFIALFITIFSLASAQKVSAHTNDITWSYYQSTINTNEEYVMLGEADLNPDTKSFQFYLNDLSVLPLYLVINQDQEWFKIEFYDGATLVKTILDSSNPAVTSTTQNLPFGEDYIYINLGAFDLYNEADNFKIYIPTNQTSLSNVQAVQADLTNNDNYSYTYDDLPLGQLGFAAELNLTTPGSTAGYSSFMSDFVKIPANTNTIYFNSSISYYSNTAYTPYAKVYYYNADKELIRELEFSRSNEDAEVKHDWLPFDDPEHPLYHVFDIPWSYYNYDISNQISYIRIRLNDYNNAYGINAMRSKSLNYNYFLDGDYTTVNWIIDNEVIYTDITAIGSNAQFFALKPNIPGQTFSHWVDANGDILNNFTITQDMVFNGQANIYGIYVDSETVATPSPLDTEPDGGNFEILLNDVGFNDAPERVIVFALVIVIATLILFGMKVPLFNILVVDGIITAFFMSLGLLPTFVTIIIIIMLLLFGYNYIIAGGGANE